MKPEDKTKKRGILHKVGKIFKILIVIQKLVLFCWTAKGVYYPVEDCLLKLEMIVLNHINR